MIGANERPSPETMATDRTKTYGSNSNLTYELRKRIINLANRIKYDAYVLVNSDQIVENFAKEIEEIRSKTEGGLS
jgi:hypothetical protein